MAIAALDLGKRRIGVAIAEGTEASALPIGAIARYSLKRDIEAIAALIGSRNVDRVVVGLPLNMDGTEGPQARAAQAFARHLSEATHVPVELYDERLTSFEAEDRLKGTSSRGHVSKKSVDAVAAAIILEGWLQSAGRTR